jgi:hypothetical protein
MSPLVAMVPRCLYMSSMPPTCCVWELVRRFCDLMLPSGDTWAVFLTSRVIQPDFYCSRAPTCDCQPIGSSPDVDNQCLVRRFAELMASLSIPGYRLEIAHSCQAPLRPVTFSETQERLSGESVGDLIDYLHGRFNLRALPSSRPRAH